MYWLNLLKKHTYMNFMCFVIVITHDIPKNAHRLYKTTEYLLTRTLLICISVKSQSPVRHNTKE